MGHDLGLASGLQRILAPVNPQEFLHTIWNKKSLHIEGSPEKFAELFSWHEFNQILAQHRLEPPRLRLEQAGKSEESLAFLGSRPARRGGNITFPDIPTLYEHLKAGATLVLDSVDEVNTNISRLCELLTRDLQAHVEVNAYSCWKAEEGFGVHWDDHDLFVVQIAGRKHWRMYEQARRSPLYRDVESNLEAPTEVLWEKVIGPGDVIYIPRGHWHAAVGIGEPTLHLTFGVNNPSGIDLMLWIVDELRGKEEFRQDIPRFGTPSELQEYSRKLKNSLDAFWAENPIDRYLAHRSGIIPARTHLSLPFGPTDIVLPATDEFEVRFSGTTFTNIIDHSASNTFEFNSLGRTWCFDVNAKKVISLLLTGHNVQFSKLLSLGNEDGIGPEQLRETLSILLLQGLIHIVPPP